MKNVISFSFLFLFFGLFSQSVFGQKTTYAGKELGIRVNPTLLGVKSGELVWKKQVGNHAWKRLRVGEVTAQAHLFSPSTVNSKLSVAFGKERRYSFSKTSNWQFVCGHELSVGARFVNNSTISHKDLGLAVGINGVLGLRYALNSKFGINVETTPGISVEKVWDGEMSTQNATNWKVSLFNPRLTLTYSLAKKG